MSFNPANLTVYVPGDGLSSASARYTTSDTKITTMGGGYFDGAKPLLRRGDTIVVDATDGSYVGQFILADVNGTGLTKSFDL